jgi:aldehyde:ferredoxin oxidoreductase
MHGATGCILHVDLSHDTLHVEKPTSLFYRKHGGGSALGTYFLLKHTPRHIDSISP